MNTEQLGIKTFILKKVEYLVEHRYNMGQLGPQFDVILRDDIHCMFLRMKKEIYSDELPHREYKWPKTWWDHTKIRWFPKWLLNRYPAKEITVLITAQMIYPNIKPNLPDEENYFRMYVKELTTAYRPRNE